MPCRRRQRQRRRQRHRQRRLGFPSLPFENERGVRRGSERIGNKIQLVRSLQHTHKRDETDYQISSPKCPKMLKSQESPSGKRERKSVPLLLLSSSPQLIVLLSVLLLSFVVVENAHAEANREFDWNDLGLSIPSSRISSLASYGGNNASSNLRILVSPQRRMTKK